MRVVEADDIEAAAGRLPLNFDQFLRGDVVGSGRGISARIPGADDLLDVIYRCGAITFASDVLAEQHATALVGVRLFAVRTQGLVIREVDAKHTGYSSCQKRSLMYFSAESQRMVTMTASR